MAFDEERMKAIRCVIKESEPKSLMFEHFPATAIFMSGVLTAEDPLKALEEWRKNKDE